MGGGRGIVLVVGLALSSATSTVAQEVVEYHVDRRGEREAVFISRASIEEFRGVTDRVDGFVRLPTGGVRVGTEFPGSEFYFEVDLASLDTGIGLRDRHMRDNYLETEEHPWATFRGRIDRVATSGDSLTVTSSGTFSVHGVDRARTIECTATGGEAAYDVRCDFPVLLGDHDIEIPRVMFLKLAEEVRVQIAFRLRPAPSGGDE